jgi:hypothetical protein
VPARCQDEVERGVCGSVSLGHSGILSRAAGHARNGTSGLPWSPL